MYSRFVEKTVFPLAQIYLHNGFLTKYRSLMNSQWLSAEKLEEIQWQRFKVILDHAYRNVPMYQRKFKEADVTPDNVQSRADMLKLPIITKEDMRTGFPQEVTAKNIPQKHWIFNSTSGSTGTPFAFIMDKTLVGSKIANHFRNLSWAGISPGSKHVKLWGTHEGEGWKQIFTRYFMRRLELSCFDLDARRFEYYKYIKKNKPAAIEAYTSALVKLTRLMISDQVMNIHIPSAIVSAETLTEKDRKLIEETLQCKVYNRYGSREFGNVAQECNKQTGLHINSESFLVEIVCGGRHASPGEQGKMIVTCFDNYAMPFIRYDTGDMGTTFAGNCSCGRGLPLLGSVDGRITDFLTTPSGKSIPCLLFNYLFEQYGPYVKQFQVNQETIADVVIKLVPGAGYTSEIEEQLMTSLRKHLDDEINISIVKVDVIPLTSAGKKICVESKVVR